ncbi:MAG: hypothetical protein E7311_01765 [Clostridiales bacterium]|nr:hypothetical protein [Clostridiales bacterium]
MENASKALLIAGAILLVIAIIAIAVGIVSSTRGTIGVAENQIDAMEVKMHNNQFTIYEGEVTGAEVKDCVSKALSNNTNTKQSEMKVWVVVTAKNSAGANVTTNYGVNGSTTYNTTFTSSSVETSARFNCVTSINSQGIINKITFTQK